MNPLTEPEIRAAFVNCTKGEARRLNVPRELAALPWEDLDFLGWRDPQAPERAYLAAELDGSLAAISLRCPGPNPLQKRSNICSFCLTGHTGGVTLMVAPRVGKPGQQGNSVGTYLCTDLACSLYLRGKKPVIGLGGRFKERLTLEEKVERTMTNLAAFMAKVTA
ncbi:MAG TPA: FBP domain-containing protein [Trebonia sp.]